MRLVPRRGTWILVSTMYAVGSAIWLLVAVAAWRMLSWPNYLRVPVFVSFVLLLVGCSVSAIVAWRMPQLYKEFPPKSIAIYRCEWWAPRALYLYVRTYRTKEVIEPTAGMATWTRAAAVAAGLASIGIGIFLAVLGVVGFVVVGAVSLILLVPAIGTVVLGILGILRRDEARPSDFPKGFRGPFAIFDPVARKGRPRDARSDYLR